MHINETRKLWMPVLLAAAAGCGLVDCGAGGGSGDGGDSGGTGASCSEPERSCSDPRRESAPLDELCPASRQIAYLPSDPGADPSEPTPCAETLEKDSLWTAESFADLRGFCRYTFKDPSANPEDHLDDLPKGAQPDCRVTPQAPIDAPLIPSYHQRFVEATHDVPDPDDYLSSTGQVRVAVIDTAPQRTAEARSEHGPTVAAIVTELADGCLFDPANQACSCSPCVETVLGLPRLGDGSSDAAHGGYFGYQSDVAAGIVAALDGWGGPSDEQLILNLSVGWEPATDQVGGVERPSVALVRQAITVARCRGALVIAASGNQPVGSCVGDAMGPAYWVSENAPVSAELGVDCFAYNQPLVYAATPVDWSRRNLFDFRPNSNAALAAAGFAGTGDLGDGLRRPMSGSSVAAATVSGIAALVWSAYPNMPGHALMELLYRSGDKRIHQGAQVRSDLDAPPRDQKVITACAALTQACCEHDSSRNNDPAGGQNRCQNLARACGHSPAQNVCVAATMPSAPTVDVPAWSAARASWRSGLDPDDRVRRLTSVRQVASCTSCGDPVTVEQPCTPLPAEHMPDPWTIPQPPTHPCPMCVLDPDDEDNELRLILDPDFHPSYTPTDLDIANVVVTLETSGGARTQIHYGRLPLNPDRLHIQSEPSVRSLQLDSAWIDVTFLDPDGSVFTAGGPLGLE